MKNLKKVSLLLLALVVFLGPASLTYYLTTNYQQAQTAAAAATQPAKKDVLVILMEFTDLKHDKSSETQASIMGKILTDKDSVNNIYRENAYCNTNPTCNWKDLTTVDVTGWTMVNDTSVFPNPGDQTSTFNKYKSWVDQAVAAVSNGKIYNPSDYKYIFVVAPKILPCNVGGSCVDVDKTGVVGNRMFINGGMPSSTYAHELGHMIYGLSHIGSTSCKNKDGYNGLDCVEKEYSRTLMGSLDAGHLPAIEKIKAGFIKPSSLVGVSKTGVYKISPIETKEDAYPKALSIQPPTSSLVNYYVEYRQPIGLDNIDTYSGSWIAMTDELGLYAVDEYLVTKDDAKPSFQREDGATFTDYQDLGHLVKITQLDHNAQYADICVSFNNETCASVTLTANPSTIMSGQSSQLTWTSQYAKSCTSNDFSTGGTATGTVSTGALTASKVYTISCTGVAGGTATASTTVTVAVPPPILPPPTASLIANPTIIKSGDSSQLTWTSQNALSCISGGFNTGGKTSGTVSTGPLKVTTMYIISCTGAGGSFSATAKVTVNSVPPPPPPSPPPPTGQTITVTSAIYGGNVLISNGSGSGSGAGYPAYNPASDVTPKVSSYVVGTCRSKSPCSYTVDYRVLGDPYPFYPKDFIVKYNCSDGTKHQNVVPPEAGYGSVTTLVCDKTTLAK